MDEIPLDAVDAGFIDLPDFGSSTDEVVLVCGNVSTTGLMSYSYRTEAEPASVGETGSEIAQLRLRSDGANPFAGSASLLLEVESDVTADVCVIDALGRRVRTLHQGPVQSGTLALSWDGLDDAGHSAAPGIYFVQARTDGASAAHRLVKLR